MQALTKYIAQKEHVLNKFAYNKRLNRYRVTEHASYFKPFSLINNFTGKWRDKVLHKCHKC